MNKTTNYKLNKPTFDDPADITQLNPNWDTIDAFMLNHGKHIPNACTIITDWDTAVTNGWYMGNNATHKPSYDGWCFGLVLAHAEDYVYQEVYGFSQSHTNVTDIKKYIRDCHKGVWSEWIEVTVQRTVPKDAKLEHITTLTSDAQTQLNSKMSVTPRRIEFTSEAGAGDGGYLDFHFEGSAEDFTSRIIEGKKGVLSFLCDKGSFGGDVTVHGGYPVYSSKDTIPIEHGGTGASDVPTARTKLNFISGTYTGTGNSGSSSRMYNYDTGARGSNVIMIHGINARGFLCPWGGFMVYDTGAGIGQSTQIQAFGQNSGEYASYADGYISLKTSHEYINVSGGVFNYWCL